MNLKKLYEGYSLSNSEFLSHYRNEDLNNAVDLDDVKSKLKYIFSQADDYAEKNNLEKKYFDVAKYPLWSGLDGESKQFVYKGFDAYVKIDMNDELDKIKPYVVVENQHVNSMKDGQYIEIDDDFYNGLDKLQYRSFKTALDEVEEKIVNKFKKVWVYEKSRMEKWIKTCPVKV